MQQRRKIRLSQERAGLICSPAQEGVQCGYPVLSEQNVCLLHYEGEDYYWLIAQAAARHALRQDCGNCAQHDTCPYRNGHTLPHWCGYELRLFTHILEVYRPVVKRSGMRNSPFYLERIIDVAVKRIFLRRLESALKDNIVLPNTDEPGKKNAVIRLHPALSAYERLQESLRRDLKELELSPTEARKAGGGPSPEGMFRSIGELIAHALSDKPVQEAIEKSLLTNGHGEE